MGRMRFLPSYRVVLFLLFALSLQKHGCEAEDKRRAEEELAVQGVEEIAAAVPAVQLPVKGEKQEGGGLLPFLEGETLGYEDLLVNPSLSFPALAAMAAGDGGAGASLSRKFFFINACFRPVDLYLAYYPSDPSLAPAPTPTNAPSNGEPSPSSASPTSPPVSASLRVYDAYWKLAANESLDPPLPLGEVGGKRLIEASVNLTEAFFYAETVPKEFVWAGSTKQEGEKAGKNVTLQNGVSLYMRKILAAPLLHSSADGSPASLSPSFLDFYVELRCDRTAVNSSAPGGNGTKEGEENTTQPPFVSPPRVDPDNSGTMKPGLNLTPSAPPAAPPSSPAASSATMNVQCVGVLILAVVVSSIMESLFSFS